jgi:hypothetical protein
MKKAFLLLTFLICSFTSFCQRDTEFWFVAPEVRVSILDYDRPIFLKFFSYDLPATVIVSMPANPAFPEQTVELDPWESFSMDLTNYIDIIENKPENSVLNFGLKITSDNSISAYYEILGDCTCNPEILPLKGTYALGRNFYVPFQTYLKNGNATDPASATIDIVASRDATTVSVTPTKNLVGHPAGTTFSISLNAGQTYSLKAASDLASEHPTGTHITADKAIAITMKDDLLNGGLEYGNYCLNIVADQIVPVSSLGKKYFVNKGGLWGTEKAFIVATQDGTTVKVKNLPNTLLDKGESMSINLAPGDAKIIKTTKPAYVLQITGTGCETSGDLVPPLDKTGTTSAGFIRSTSEPFYLSLLTLQGNQNGFSLNGNTSLIDPNSFTVVPGSGGQYVTSRILLSMEDLPVNQANWINNSIGTFQTSILNGAEYVTGSRFGIFTDYAPHAPLPTQLKIAETTLNLFPNPVQDIATIEINVSQYIQPILILTDLAGKKLKEVELLETSNQVDLSQLPDGIYLYFIIDQGGQRHAGKIIKTE